MHSSRLLQGGGGSFWATTKTIVHLGTIQIMVLSRLFADAIPSWVKNTMLVFGTMALQQFAHFQFLAFDKLFYFIHPLETFPL